MKLKKGLFVICLVILMMFCVSSASAADSDENMTSTDMNDILKTSEDTTVIEDENNEIIGEEFPLSFTELQGIIDNGYGSEIKLDNDVYWYSGENPASITQNITIDGQGHILLGDKYHRILEVTGANVVIKNITFMNGGGISLLEYCKGGAVYWSGSNGVLSDCSFVDNYNANYGGAVYWAGSYGAVSNCSFVNNSVYNDGGAVYWAANNGMLSDCSFVNNSAHGSGGAVCWSGSNGVISDCSFVNNTVDYSGGGAIIFKDNADSIVYNCSFVNNRAKESYGGGAIRFWNSDNSNVSDCRFVNNIASRNSGAILWEECDDAVLSNCIFINNTSQEYSTGAVDFFLCTNVTVSGCHFENNVAKDCGALYVGYGDNVTVSDCSFVNNTANNGDGGALYLVIDKNCTVSGCSFVSNVANGTGGAIYCSNFDAVVSDCSFVSNVANGAGGAIYSVDMRGIVSNCIFVNNAAGEGIIYYKWGDNLKINNNIFINYHAAPIVNESDTANCDYNWFGADETNYMDNPGVEGCDVWLFLKATSSPDTISVLSSSNILFKLYAYNSTSPSIADYDNDVLKHFNFTVTSTNGIVDANITKFGKAVRYTATSGGTGMITISFESHPIASAKVNVNKLATGLTSKTTVTSYNSGKNLVVTLKDSKGNPVSGAKITVDLNGVKTYTSDKNGHIKVPISNLVPKAYVAKIKFNGNGAYLKSAKSVKVTVNKAKPKITAKAKSFKKSLKVKKYTVTLKTGKNPVKKVKVTLKIGKKTYTAKTNSKGKATFKIKKLSKKGTYKSKVTFKGNKYYKKVTKTVKIKIK